MKYFLLLLVFLPLKTFSCSAFFCDGKTKYLAKNFDWGSGQGYVIKNKSGQKKFAYGFRGTNQASWTSKYGSVTFNQIGKEFPYGGINEKGLVVEQLWMSESIYQDNKNQNISELEWIQFQLDNYSTIEEVVKNLDKLTIKPIATIHYLIADRNGNSAVIDFVDGKTVVNKKEGRHQVITNETLSNSEKYFEINKSDIDKNSRTHYDRFCQIKNSLLNTEIENPNQAFEILANSAENQENYKTYWSIVYDLTNLKVYFKSFDSQTIKEINLSEIKLDSNSTLEASNINQDHFRFEPYTFETNKDLFSSAMTMMQLKVDEEMAANHQMSPNQLRNDKIYQANYADLLITFISKKATGKIYYTLLNGTENFGARKGFKAGTLSIDNVENKKMIYAMPKVEFALACFQDSDLDGRMDTKIFGIPKNYGFSNNKRGFFGTPPNYADSKVTMQGDMEIVVRIK